jgi:hypothetical protein
MWATRDGETMSKYIGDLFVRRNIFFAVLYRNGGVDRVNARPYVSKG